MWTARDYLFRLEAAAEAAAALFRTDFSRPGFALLDLADPLPPSAFRDRLLRLIGELSAHFERAAGRPLEVVSVNRFDQQATTRPHLDGAPVESFLVLGYEPTPVESRLALLDYPRYAHDHRLTVRQFLEQFNPWSVPDWPGLGEYFTPVEAFAAARPQILLINNSSCEFGAGQLGVMHQADIPAPDANASRVINSIVLATPDPAAPPRPAPELLRRFVEDGTPAA
jgi:hypothetical protein